MRLTITEQHLDKAIADETFRSRPTSCPIAQGIRERFPEPVYLGVTPDHASVRPSYDYGDMHTYRLSSTAQRVVDLFDVVEPNKNGVRRMKVVAAHITREKLRAMLPVTVILKEVK